MPQFDFGGPPKSEKSHFQIANLVIWWFSSSKSEFSGSSFGNRHSIYVLKGWYNETPQKVPIAVIFKEQAFLPYPVQISYSQRPYRQRLRFEPMTIKIWNLYSKTWTLLLCQQRAGWSIKKLCELFFPVLNSSLSPVIHCNLLMTPPPRKISHNVWTIFDANLSIYDWYSLLSSVKWGVQPPS